MVCVHGWGCRRGRPSGLPDYAIAKIAQICQNPKYPGMFFRKKKSTPAQKVMPKETPKVREKGS